MIVLSQAIDADIAAIVENVWRGLVHVRNGRRGSGAGTIWHPQGLVVTNAHVVGRGPVKVALADGRVLPAQILASDADSDLAALRVEAEDLPTIELGDSRRLRAGHWVVAIGHPWGVEGAATAGIVIGSGSEWPEMPRSGRDWIVVSLHMRPGHSGGPLVDVRGRLMGINTMINGPDVGLAVPTHVIVEFLQRSLLK
jgi:S1-C subfamily serine protease